MNRWLHVAAGLAVLSGAPALAGVLRGWAWLACAASAVGLVVLVGLLMRAPGRPWWTPIGPQALALLVQVTVLFGKSTLLGVLPGPATLQDLADQLSQIGDLIDAGVPPIPASGQLLLLVCLVFGVLAIVADAVTAAGYGAAACGLVLLCAFTVSTTLAKDALPNWSLVSGAAGFGLLLMVEQRRRQGLRRLEPAVTAAAGPDAPAGAEPEPSAPGRVRGTGVGVIVIAAALAVGLLVGAVATAVGTEGRFPGKEKDQANQDLQFGLDPFTSVHNQLARPDPVDLLRVRGMPDTTYLRALTLTEYVPSRGWQVPSRRGDEVLDATLSTGLPTPPAGSPTVIDVENVGYQDRWLPLAGLPLGVTGVTSGRWHYDVGTATAYTREAVREAHWTIRAVLFDPSADALNALPATSDVDPGYLDTGGVDPRVGRLAADVTGRAHTPFGKAAALNRYFLDPANGFHYSLTTAPGNSGAALVDFLERGRAGYCEQFASAMAVMLRSVGVPARVAVGFTAGRLSQGVRTINTKDAHAWVEAFFPGYGWLTFDPTPLGDGRAVTPGYLSDGANVPTAPPPADQLTPQAGGPGNEPTSPQGGQDTTPQGSNPGGGQDSQPAGAGQDGSGSTGTDQAGSPLTAVLIGLLIGFGVLALLAAPATARRVARYRRRSLAGQGGPEGAAAAWREVLAESRDHGGPVPGNTTVRTTARTLVIGHRLDAPSSHAVRSVVDAVERGWYAPPSSGVSGTVLVDSLTEAAEGLQRAVPLRLPDRLWPRSVRPSVGRMGGRIFDRTRSG